MVAAFSSSGCLTLVNRPKVTLRPEAPAVDARAGGCNVQVFEDGTAFTAPHLDIADVTLEWPRDKIAASGPDGALKTLRESACEQGAFVIYDLRALTNGYIEAGMIYEATFATLLDANGKPLNAKKVEPADNSEK